MKKILCILLVICLTFALAACGNIGKVTIGGTDTTLKEMAKEFKTNEPAAKAKYEGKDLVVIDKIKSINGACINNGTYLEGYIETKGGCRAEISESEASNFSPGDTVKIEGNLFNYFTNFEIYKINGHDVKISLYEG